MFAPDLTWASRTWNAGFVRSKQVRSNMTNMFIEQSSPLVECHGLKPAWVLGKITQQLGPLTYVVSVTDG